MLLLALSMSGLTAYATDDEEIIELRGDRYVIHVDRMIASPHSDQRSENPDSEMTLLDVLNTCPEFLSQRAPSLPSFLASSRSSSSCCSSATSTAAESLIIIGKTQR